MKMMCTLERTYTRIYIMLVTMIKVINTTIVVIKIKFDFMHPYG